MVASQVQDLHLGHAGQVGHSSVCERLLAVHAGRADIQTPAPVTSNDCRGCLYLSRHLVSAQHNKPQAVSPGCWAALIHDSGWGYKQCWLPCQLCWRVSAAPFC